MGPHFQLIFKYVYIRNLMSFKNKLNISLKIIGYSEFLKTKIHVSNTFYFFKYKLQNSCFKLLKIINKI